MPIGLHIERLVIEGVEMTPVERTVFAESLRHELTRLLQGGLDTRLRTGLATPSIAAAPAVLGAPFDARRAGVSVAHAVYSGIGATQAPAESEP